MFPWYGLNKLFELASFLLIWSPFLKKVHFTILFFFGIFPELYRCCTVGDLPRVKELLEEASAVTINKLYQGGSTLLYKYVKHLI